MTYFDNYFEITFRIPAKADEAINFKNEMLKFAQSKGYKCDITRYTFIYGLPKED